MVTELERRVAEMPCPCAYNRDRCQACGTRDEFDACLEDCGHCQGTSLWWEGLSRRCEWDYHDQCAECGSKDDIGHESCCNGSGRVPDVTQEKLMRLGLHIWFQPKGVIGEEDCFVAVHHGFDPTNPFTADTPTDAGCAALIASIE